MKNRFEAEYLAFAGWLRILIMLVLLVITCLLSFFLTLIWQLGIIMAPSLSMIILVFMDYFIFSGTNSKRSKGMELLKSSPRGSQVLQRALKQDIVNKSVFSLIAISFTVALILIGRSASGAESFEDSNLFVIIFAFGAFATGQVLTRIALLLTRNKGLTLHVHMLLAYLIFFLGTAIMLPLIFLSETHSIPIMSGYAAVMEVLSILTGKLLISSCGKAYDASFCDDTVN